jgi:hypothetical protein
MLKKPYSLGCRILRISIRFKQKTNLDEGWMEASLR